MIVVCLNGFDSKLVRLKASFENSGLEPRVLFGFDSKLVRLKVESNSPWESSGSTFRFQTGSIKRARKAMYARFTEVSIPNWFD